MARFHFSCVLRREPLLSVNKATCLVKVFPRTFTVSTAPTNKIEVDRTIEDFADHPSVKLITEKGDTQSFSFSTVNDNYLKNILDSLPWVESV